MKIQAHYLISVFCLALSPLATARPFDASEIHLLESAQSEGKRADNPVLIRFGKRHSLDDDSEEGDAFTVMQRSSGQLDGPLIRFGKRGGSIFPSDQMSLPLTSGMFPGGRFRPTRSDKKNTQIDPLIRFGKRAGNKADMMIRFGRDPFPPKRLEGDTMLRFGRANKGQPLLMRLGKKST